MSSTVEQIKQRLGIAEVVGTYMKLDKAGTNFKGKCPFHNEKTPSFFVSPDRNSYYCFGCGAKGDIFSFVQEFERVDFIGSLKILAERAGVEIERVNPETKNEREMLFSALEHATLFFINNLTEGSAPREYLKKRGLTDETIKEWRIGYVADEWNSIGNYLRTKGISEQTMEKAGLIKKGEKGTYYDRFRGRIMFPLFDPSGRVIGFSGRILVDKEGEAKYLNSPETELFNKSIVLYGYHKAKNEIRVKDYSILVEGQMDLLLSHQEGFKNTVASSGTALTVSHLEILKRISNKVMVVYDSDTAGLNASLKAWQNALSIGMDVKIAALPAGKDPAELIIEDKEKWKECLKASKHIIDFYLDALLSKGLDARKLGIAIQDNVLPYVRALESSIEQSHFIGKIAHAANIKEDALWAELRKIPLEETKSQPEAAIAKEPTRNISPLGAVERKIIGLMLLKEEKSKEGGRELREKLEEILGKERLEEILQENISYKDELVLEAEEYFADAIKEAMAVKELLASLDEERWKAQFARKMEELSKAERDKDAEKIRTLLGECQEISKKLAILYNNHHTK
jgi:DNA primase